MSTSRRDFWDAESFKPSLEDAISSLLVQWITRNSKYYSCLCHGTEIRGITAGVTRTSGTRCFSFAHTMLQFSCACVIINTYYPFGLPFIFSKYLISTVIILFIFL
jgi:hypothetical protein